MSLLLATHLTDIELTDLNLTIVKPTKDVNSIQSSISINGFNDTDGNDNLTTVFNTSIAPFFQNPVSDSVELTILCIKGIIFGTIIIGAVLGNALVIISVQKNRKLR